MATNSRAHETTVVSDSAGAGDQAKLQHHRTRGMASAVKSAKLEG